MKLIGASLLSVAILLGTMAGESAQARSSRDGHDGKSAQSGKSDDGGKKGHRGRSHRHARPGVFVLTPVWPLFPPWWGYPRYTPEWSEPVVYIERDSVPARPPEYWYYCPDAQEFHPEVKDCPGGWQELVSQPPPAP